MVVTLLLKRGLESLRREETPHVGFFLDRGCLHVGIPSVFELSRARRERRCTIDIARRFSYKGDGEKMAVRHGGMHAYFHRRQRMTTTTAKVEMLV